MKRKQTTRQRRNRVQAPAADFQALETRQLLAGITWESASGVITVDGSSSADTVLVSTAGTQLTVAFSGVATRSFTTTEVREIRFFGRDGDDSFRNDAAVPSLAYGQKGNDTLTGGSLQDVLHGGGGADQLFGAGGDDLLIGDTGADLLNGGAGVDWLDGGADNDQLFGMEGDDTIYTGAGDNAADGGAGNDRLYGFTGVDTLLGGTGNDLLAGNDSPDLLNGGEGNDLLYAGNGDDRVFGEAGDDRLFGDAGKDWLDGGSQSDLVQGGDGEDSLVGGSGDDNMFGGAGQDWIHGEDGNDALSGNEGNDRIRGGNGNDRQWGGDGDDSLSGDGGDDLVTGGGGNDSLFGDDGLDTVMGDDGLDRLFGGAGADGLFGGAAADLVSGQSGDDLLMGGGGDDSLYGDDGRDRLFGDDDRDDLFGGLDDDSLMGGNSFDRLFGQSGSDDLWGDSGDDDLNGGAGVDRMRGGGGNDDFSSDSSDDLFDDSEDYQANGDFEIRGTVSGLDTTARTFQLLGITVQYSGARVEGTLANGGFFKAEGTLTAGVLQAHHVEPKLPTDSSDNFEARGAVSELDSTARTFRMLGLTIQFGSAEVQGTLQNGALVKVEGNLAGQVVTAREVKNGIGQDDNNATRNFEIRGQISGLDTTARTFSLLGFQVQYSGAQVFGTLANGAWFKADGNFNGSVLTAREIQAEQQDDRDENMELVGEVSQLDPVARTFELLGIRIDYSQAEVVQSFGNGSIVEVEGWYQDNLLRAERVR